VQLGDNTSLGANWGQQTIETNFGAGREEFEGENYCVKSVHQLCLSLNMTGGARYRAPSPPELHHTSPLFPSLPLGPTRQEFISFSAAAAASSLLNPIFNRIQSENGKSTQTATKNCK
jgi:hypothetical protein